MLKCGQCGKPIGQYDNRVYFGEEEGHLCVPCAEERGWPRLEGCLIVRDEQAEERA